VAEPDLEKIKAHIEEMHGLPGLTELPMGVLPPHVLMRPTLKRGRFTYAPGDSHNWEVRYGDLRAFGSTPAAAMKMFDQLWEGR
tara:strand:- start:332 stop:583 length:252 start_codon:yes stop_codon:yes gene_type:complete